MVTERDVRDWHRSNSAPYGGGGDATARFGGAASRGEWSARHTRVASSLTLLSSLSPSWSAQMSSPFGWSLLFLIFLPFRSIFYLTSSRFFNHEIVSISFHHGKLMSCCFREPFTSSSGHICSDRPRNEARGANSWQVRSFTRLQ